MKCPAKLRAANTKNHTSKQYIETVGVVFVLFVLFPIVFPAESL